METDNTYKIIYDGQCKLCMSSVAFVKNTDRKKKFNFIPFQINESKQEEKYEKTGVSASDSVIFDINGKKYEKSTAVLRILREMGFPWNMFYVFILIPKSLRDMIYDQVAKRRHRFISIIR